MTGWMALAPMMAEAAKEAPEGPRITRNEKMDHLSFSSPFIVGGDGNLAPRSQANMSLLTLIVVAGVAAIVIFRK